MKFEFSVGEEETHLVEFKRSAMFGSLEIKVDGDVAEWRSATDISTHLNFELKRDYTFGVGKREKHQVTIQHERPLFFAGFRTHTASRFWLM